MTCRNGSHYECHKCRERATCDEFKNEREQSEKMIVPIFCRECGTKVQLRVYEKDYEEWYKRRFAENPRHIQDIFPYLSAGEREMFLTRICDECFKKIFERLYGEECE